MNQKIPTLLSPQYTKQFSCIGSACKDSCCAGWRIDIDKETYKKYKSIPNYTLRQKLKTFIIKQPNNNSNTITQIKLVNNHCPFILDSGLCEIQTALGHSSLSLTCQTYPRVINKIDNMLELSLTLSCPEACRLVLLNQEPIIFDETSNLIPSHFMVRALYENQPTLATWKNYFWDLRIFTISLLQNRSYSLENRLIILALFYHKLETLIQNNSINDIPALIATHGNYISNNSYENLLGTIPECNKIQLLLIKNIIFAKSTRGTPGKYSTYFNQLTTILNSNISTSSEILLKYKEGFDNYYIPFITKHGYMLENYLVNYVFKNLMPIDHISPLKSFMQMILHFSIIKIHLISYGLDTHNLTWDSCLDIIQAFSKQYEHNQAFFNQLLTVLEKENYLTLAYLTILIKN